MRKQRFRRTKRASSGDNELAQYRQQQQQQQQQYQSGQQEFVIVDTVGNGDCFGISFGESLLAAALYGEQPVKNYFRTNKKAQEGLAKLFSKLNEQLQPTAQKFLSLEKSDQEQSDQDFAGKLDQNLEQLRTRWPAQERQKRLGQAMRSIFVDSLKEIQQRPNMPKYSSEDDPRGLLYFHLHAALEVYLASGGDKKLPGEGDEFYRMAFVGKKFAEIAAGKQDQKLSDDQVEQALEAWWYQDGFASYIDQYSMQGTYLGEFAAGILSSRFGVNLSYEYEQEGKNFFNEFCQSHRNAPVLSMYYNGKNHWAARIAKSEYNAFNHGLNPQDRQLSLNESLTKNEEKNRSQRLAEFVAPMDFDETNFYQNLTAAYQSKDDDDDDATTTSEYDPDTQTLTIADQDNIRLRIVGRKVYRSRYQGGAADQRAAMVSEIVIYPEYYGGDDDNEQSEAESAPTKLEQLGKDAKQKVLDKMAHAYAKAFVAAGMDKDNLQIHVTRIASPWKQDPNSQQAIKAAFIKAGFKRIQILDDEVYNPNRVKYAKNYDKEKAAEYEKKYGITEDYAKNFNLDSYPDQNQSTKTDLSDEGKGEDKDSDDDDKQEEQGETAKSDNDNTSAAQAVDLESINENEKSDNTQIDANSSKSESEPAEVAVEDNVPLVEGPGPTDIEIDSSSNASNGDDVAAKQHQSVQDDNEIAEEQQGDDVVNVEPLDEKKLEPVVEIATAATGVSNPQPLPRASVAAVASDTPADSEPPLSSLPVATVADTRNARFFGPRGRTNQALAKKFAENAKNNRSSITTSQ